MRMFDVPEVLSVHEVLSEEVRIVPDSPTETYNVLSVLLEPSSLPQEMMVKLKRSKERMMSRCFIWFPISGFRRILNITSIGLNYNVCGCFDLRICLVGVIILFLVVVW